MILQTLIINIMLIFSLTVMICLISQKWTAGDRKNQVVSGVVFGTIAVMSMVFPICFKDGLIFDGRSVVVSMSGLFGGPVVALISAFVSISYRLLIGGVGALTGTAAIVTSAAFGVGYHYLWKKDRIPLNAIHLYGFGLIVHIAVLLWMFTLPGALKWEVLNKISLPFITILPISTLFLGMLLHRQAIFNKNEKELSESEDRYSNLISNMRDGVAVYRAVNEGQDFILVDINKSVEKIETVKRDEIVGKSVLEIFPGIKEFGLFDVFQRVWKSGEPALHPESFYHDGRISGWRENYVFKIPSGEIVAVYSDKTEKKRIEKERDQLFNLSLDMLCIAGFDGYFKQINPAWGKTLGWDEKELLSKPWLDFVHPEDRESTVNAGNQLKSGNEVMAFQNRYRSKDGSYRRFSWNAYPQIKEGLIFAIARDITDFIKVENAVWENEEILKAIFKAAENVSFIVTDAMDPEPLVLEFSAGAEKIFGYDRNEMIGNPVSVLHLQEDVKKFPEIHKVMRKGKACFSRETTLIRKSGEKFPAFFSTYPLFDHNGYMYAALGVSIDISDTKAAHQALIESEKKYRQLVEYAPAGICELDLVHGRFTGVNDVICEYSGYTKEEFLKLTPLDLLSEPSQKKMMERHQEISEGKKVSEPVECEIRGKYGQKFWVMLNSKFFYENGKAIKALTVIHNITDRKQAENALMESEEKYRHLVENINDVLFSTDMEGFITYVSPVIESLAGYDPSECIGKPFFNFIFEDDKELVKDKFKALLSGNKGPTEYRILSKYGESIWVKTSSNLIFNEEKAIGIQGILTDLTLQKNAEKEKKELERQLFQAQKMEAIGRLTGGISHDFNNLLTVINGNAFMALMQIDEQNPLYEDISEIKNAGERAAVLIRQLLAFSRSQIANPKVMDLNDVLTDFERILRRMIGEDILLKTKKEASLAHVEVDSGQIEQVVMNLVVNARDAMPQGGKLLIETQNVYLDESYFRDHGIKEAAGHYAMLSVSDSGCGMDQETQTRIFEPFYSTKEKGQGTGLGLSTVYGIVKQNNGFVWVYSEPGIGTTFKIYLPVVEGETEPIKKEKTAVVGLKGPETVLIVEDEILVRNLAGRVLKRHGYKVLEAQNGPEALRIVEEYDGQIDLLIADLVMPGMSGIEAAERIKAMRPSIHILYMSGYTRNALEQNQLLHRNLPFLEKPFTPEGLTYKVGEILDGPGRDRSSRKSIKAESDAREQGLCSESYQEEIILERSE